MTYRVEITRDETRAGAVTIDITAYIDRVPETNEAGIGRLARAPTGVWNSRLLYSGDFNSLAEALAAIAAAYPAVDRIECWEWPPDYEDKLEMAPLHRSDDTWSPGRRPAYGPPAKLDWSAG